MKTKLSFSLKLLAVFYWSYIPTFLLSFSSYRYTDLGQIFVREAQVANWEFELLFLLIFMIWGIFLWKVSNNPYKHRLFIDFTLFAGLIHILWMLFVASVNTMDTLHLVKDAAVFSIPLVLVYYFYKKHD